MQVNRGWFRNEVRPIARMLRPNRGLARGRTDSHPRLFPFLLMSLYLVDDWRLSDMNETALWGVIR
jgi:hypothetical protein